MIARFRACFKAQISGSLISRKAMRTGLLKSEIKLDYSTFFFVFQSSAAASIRPLMSKRIWYLSCNFLLVCSVITIPNDNMRPILSFTAARDEVTQCCVTSALWATNKTNMNRSIWTEKCRVSCLFVVMIESRKIRSPVWLNFATGVNWPGVLGKFWQK